jgi:RecA-family ATPase
MNTILTAALQYAGSGLPVFPCKPFDKAPLVSSGFYAATQDPDQIKAWWRQWPDAMIGMPTGAASGIDVLDLDLDDEKGKNGYALIPDWKDRSPIIVRTPRGGAHLWFKSDGTMRNTTDDIAHGVDTRGAGGYVILPPSQNGSAAYQFEQGSAKDLAALPLFPADLRARLHIDDTPRTPNEDAEADPALVAAALASIPNDDLGWEEWNRIGMACWAATNGSDEGREAFEQWSAKSAKYNAQRTAARWRHYFKGPPNELGAGTLFYLAQEAAPGWSDAYYAGIEATINDVDPEVLAELMAELRGREAPKETPKAEAPKAEAPKPRVNATPPPKFYPLIGEVAVKLWGEPTERTATEFRFSGQKALLLRTGAWFDFENNVGGTLRDLMQMASSAAGTTVAVTLPVIDISRWDDEPVPPQEWAVPDRVPIDKTTLFSGEGAAGQSLIQLQLSVAQALGRDWLGTIPRQGPALFIDAEDDIGVIHKRLADILNHYRARFSDVKDQLHLVSLVGQDTVLGAYVRRSGKIEPTPLYKKLFEMAGDLKPKIIGIASSADVFAGSEIDRPQVQQFVALLTRIATVAHGGLVLISHPSLTGITTDTGLSGSTQWHNSVRARFYLKSIKPLNNDQPDTDLREIVFKKNNYGPVSASIGLRYQNGLFLPIEGATIDAAARMEIAKDVFLEILRRFTQENRKVSANLGPGYAPKLFAEEQEAKEAMCSKEALAGAMRALLQSKTIIQEQYGRRDRPNYRLAINTAARGDEPL